MPSIPGFLTNTPLHPSFDKDIRDTHLVYDYDAQDENGNPEKWRYEMWFFSENRIVYAIHGGPMAGRINYQTCTYQCIRPGELWQCNWLEETGTICSLVYDIKEGTISTLLGFSKGHWECPKEAHGDKRDPETFERWRGLAKIGNQADRFMLTEQAKLLETFKGKGNLEPIEKDAVTFYVTIPFPPFVGSGFSQTDYAQYVNPLIGSEGPIPGLALGGGDIFVGGALPFGVVKVGIDTYEDNVSYSTLNGGYTPNGRVTAISMLHESGTGGFPKYGVVPQMPLTDVSPPVNLLDNTTYFQQRVGNDTAKLGYFKTQLENGVTIELSAARHSGIMQYEFPADGEKHVLVDISHYLPDENGGSSVQVYLGSQMHIDENSKQYTGYGTWGGGWNRGAPFTVYFCGDFDTAPDEAKSFRGRNTDPMIRFHTYSNEPYQQPIFGNDSETSGSLSDRLGALFTWSNSSISTIKSRVGVSFISAENACQFRDDEVPTWSLNDTVAAAVEEWNRDVFSKIRVPTDDSRNRTDLVLLYSSLYFMHLMPSDRTGENPLWDSDEPSWDDFYTAWDIFRCTTTLYHIIQPAYYEGMIRALIDIWRYEGYMPDGRSGNYNGMVQGGSNADNILADAYVRGLRGQVNWKDGYLAMVKDAEVQPYTTFALPETAIGRKEGRGCLNDWITTGYVSSDQSTMPVSRSVEYALNDFALSQVGKNLAPDDVQKYLNRSRQWQNIWAHNFTSSNFTGFLGPRLANGTFDLADYNPAMCGGCSVSDISYEATPFEYSFTIPHDMQTLIEFMGGPEAFESRLDYIFQPGTAQQDLGANGAGITTIMNIGNEPDFATPYEYHYLNKQAKSVQRSRELSSQYFHDAPYGIPGNSDAGAMNSWLVWQQLGFYPVVTQTIFLIASPWFDDINITVNHNYTLRVTANGLDNESGSYYVQSVKINGKQWDKNWVEHDELMVTGGTVEFELGNEMEAWETGPPPPSPGRLAQ